MKSGTKKLSSYLSNEAEWAEFWVAINRYVEKPVKGKKKSTIDIDGIVFSSMNEVRFLNKVYCID